MPTRAGSGPTLLLREGCCLLSPSSRVGTGLPGSACKLGPKRKKGGKQCPGDASSHSPPTPPVQAGTSSGTRHCWQSPQHLSCSLRRRLGAHSGPQDIIPALRWRPRGLGRLPRLPSQSKCRSGNTVPAGQEAARRSLRTQPHGAPRAQVPQPHGRQRRVFAACL